VIVAQSTKEISTAGASMRGHRNPGAALRARGVWGMHEAVRGYSDVRDRPVTASTPSEIERVGRPSSVVIQKLSQAPQCPTVRVTPPLISLSRRTKPVF
jgi:hypothetical protein